MDRRSAFSFVPLQEKNYKDVVAAYRPHLYDFKAGHAPRRLSARVEWIGMHCIHGPRGPEEQERCDKVKSTEVRIVGVSNSPS